MNEQTSIKYRKNYLFWYVCMLFSDKEFNFNKFKFYNIYNVVVIYIFFAFNKIFYALHKIFKALMSKNR